MIVCHLKQSYDAIYNMIQTWWLSRGIWPLCRELIRASGVTPSAPVLTGPDHTSGDLENTSFTYNFRWDH